MSDHDLSPVVVEELEKFREMTKKYLGFEVSDHKFQKFRLQHGVYSQRQNGVHMIRMKIPLGKLNATQLECVADLAENIGHGIAHVTTRQDFQIHYVSLNRVPELISRLEAVGLTTREACGNTVRNVTASPSAGVDPQEAFDVTPYAQAYVVHLLRNPICQILGRKFKAAFDGGGVMSALPKIHDLGVVAALKNEQRGFRVYVGGGLGGSPKAAQLLYDFIPVEELIPLGHAILKVFDRYGERKIRMKARMKFLIIKMGFEKFREEVEKERALLEVDPAWNEYLKNIPPDPTPPSYPAVASTVTDTTPDYLLWKRENVYEQKQKGYYMVEVRLLLGDLTPMQLRGLAEMARQYTGDDVCLMVHQNILLRWIRGGDLPLVYQQLKKISLHKPYANQLYDVTACPGTDTCRLGIASSRGLALSLEKTLEEAGESVRHLAKDLKIKISGCPNSCGQHHLANIGFHGAASPQKEHVVPAFQLFLGGTYTQDHAVASLMMQVPAKRVPQVTLRLLEHYVQQKMEGETFNAFYQRLGKTGVKQLLAPLVTIPSYEEDPSFYVDWEGEQEFGLVQGIIGECQGSTVSDKVPHFEDAQKLFDLSRAYLENGEYAAVLIKSFETIAAAANVLLYKRLIEPFRDVESVHSFENHFVRTGIFPQYAHFVKKVLSLKNAVADEPHAREIFVFVEQFLDTCRAYEKQ